MDAMSMREITGAEHDRQSLEAMRVQARNGRDPLSEVQVDHLVRIGRTQGEAAAVQRMHPFIDLLLAVIKNRHLAGGLSGHSPGCGPHEQDLSAKTCRCGSMELYVAYHRVLDECLASDPSYRIPDLDGLFARMGAA